MTETQINICNLLANALFNIPLHENRGFNWSEIYNEMRKQTIQGLIGAIIQELHIAKPIEEQWKTDIRKIVSHGTNLCYIQTQLVELFEKDEIPYIVIKGTAAAVNYPEPLLRTAGDIDLYVPGSHYERAVALLRKVGCIEHPHNAENHRHKCFYRGNIEIELHRTYATVNSKKEKEYVDGLLECCCHNRSKDNREIGWVRYSDQRMNFKMPSVTVNGIVLLEHIAHHLMEGLGLKQVIDWIMYVNLFLDDENWLNFQETAQKAGLVNLAKVVTRTGQIYFGLKDSITWCKEADPQVCKEFIEYIFESGNFGNKQPEIGKVAKIRHRATGVIGFFINLQNAGTYNWKAYKKHHWLRPVAWLYQIGRYTRQVIKVPGAFTALLKSKSETKRRELLMEQLGVYKMTAIDQLALKVKKR